MTPVDEALDVHEQSCARLNEALKKLHTVNWKEYVAAQLAECEAHEKLLEAIAEEARKKRDKVHRPETHLM